MFWQKKKNKISEDKGKSKLVVVYPWIAWSEEDTKRVRKAAIRIFEKDVVDLGSGDASFVLEMWIDNNEDKNLQMVVPESIAKELIASGALSMDPNEKDLYGRKRYPEIVREIGFSQAALDELNIRFGE